MSTDVQDRIEALTSYNTLVQDYVDAKSNEDEARAKTEEIEAELRALVVKIGSDPMKVLPRKRRAKKAEKITEPEATDEVTEDDDII